VATPYRGHCRVRFSGARNEYPNHRQAAVLMETRTGKILRQRNKDLSLAPASTTKILTALVVIERSKASDVVTVPVEATVATGGTAHLRAGERRVIGTNG